MQCRTGHRDRPARATRARRRLLGGALLLATLPLLGGSPADPPARTENVEILDLRVEFRVQTLFTIDGAFAPVTGEVRFAPEGGPMSGELRVDAATADTGYALRDAVIREDVLEAHLHPVIAFRPKTWRVRGRNDTQLSGTISGVLALHGVERPVDVELEARLGSAGHMDVRCGLALELEDWNIPNPGNAYLPVEPRVGVVISGTVRTRSS